MATRARICKPFKEPRKGFPAHAHRSFADPYDEINVEKAPRKFHFEKKSAKVYCTTAYIVQPSNAGGTVNLHVYMLGFNKV
jgi:hypothetical protein